MTVRVWRTDSKGHSISGILRGATAALGGFGGSGGGSSTARRRRGALAGHTAPVECVTSVTSTLVASASLDETCRIWDVQAMREVQTLKGHRREALCVVADYPMLVSSSDDRTVRVWDCRSGSTVQVLRGAHSGSIYAVELVTPNCIISGGADGRLATYDIRMAAGALAGADAEQPPPQVQLSLKEGAHGIRACNQICKAEKAVSVGGAEPSSLWSFGDDGCLRAWRLEGEAPPRGLVEVTPRNGEAAACLGRGH